MKAGRRVLEEIREREKNVEHACGLDSAIRLLFEQAQTSRSSQPLPKIIQRKETSADAGIPGSILPSDAAYSFLANDQPAAPASLRPAKKPSERLPEKQIRERDPARPTKLLCRHDGIECSRARPSACADTSDSGVPEQSPLPGKLLYPLVLPLASSSTDELAASNFEASSDREAQGKAAEEADPVSHGIAPHGISAFSADTRDAGDLGQGAFRLVKRLQETAKRRVQYSACLGLGAEY
ncbi:MAG: hypothetical protein Q9174_006007 [Haloplaca sp. 1 TL-2023]